MSIVEDTSQPSRVLFREGRSYVEGILLPEILGGRPCMYIHKVFVAEETRRAGVGGMLLEKAKDFAIRRGCHKVFLICKTDVVGFYKGCGYEGCGYVEDQHVMTLRLGGKVE